MKAFFIALMLFVGSTAHTQDYIEYQRIINRTNVDILDSNFKSALGRMDTIDQQYHFIYASHCVKALQLAFLVGDEARADHWLRRAIMQGTPLWALRTNTITEQALRWPSLLQTAGKYDSLHAIYLSRIDTALARRIEHLLNRDAHYTRRVNDEFFLFRHTIYGLSWMRNNSRQIREIERIVAEYGYPDEQLIGLGEDVNDSARLSTFIRRGGIGLTLQNRKVFIMYLHYFSTKRKEISPALAQQVRIGNMPVYQYARLHDYLAASRKYHHRNIAYHEFEGIGPSEDTTGLDSCRAAIGLPPFVIGDSIRRIIYQREFSGIANKAVILE